MTAAPALPTTREVARPAVARSWHAATAGLAAAALLLHVVPSIRDGIAPTAGERLANLVALRGVLELQGLEVWTDTVFHYLVPALTVVGWVAFGPRLRTDLRTLLLALLWPVAWLAYTLVRGELVGWYPYPFIDVTELGHGSALVNTLLVTLLMLAVGAAYLGADRLLARRRR